MLLCIVPSGLVNKSFLGVYGDDFSVLDYGAVGDGITDDSQAFLQAWEAMCGAEGDNPILQIPTRTFLLNPITFSGPCKSTNPHITHLGTLVAPKRDHWKSHDHWISITSTSGLLFDGSGTIDGQGDSWWECARHGYIVNNMDGCPRPTSLQFHDTKGLTLTGITSINSPANHISLDSCNEATISNIRLTAPEDSPNTDGIDISQSQNIQIQDSFIGTGDDCVAINGGCSFINITNVACGPGHGISIGSLGEEKGVEDTVEEVRVTNCNFTRTQNGVRIKTYQGGAGYARKITFEGITFEEVKNPIIIDQMYSAEYTSNSEASDVQISDVKYNGIHGSSAKENAITLNCSSAVPCNNIYMNDVNIAYSDPSKPTTSTCINVHGTATSISPTVTCLDG